MPNSFSELELELWERLGLCFATILGVGSWGAGSERPALMRKGDYMRVYQDDMQGVYALLLRRLMGKV